MRQQPESQPPLAAVRYERDPSQDRPIVPTWELAPNQAEIVAKAELKDLDRRIHQPCTDLDLSQVQLQPAKPLSGKNDSESPSSPSAAGRTAKVTAKGKGRRSGWKDALKSKWRRIAARKRPA
jgi:hypothetical protein